MRFHQAITFLPITQVVPLATACDQLGYAGIYLSDHLFNPRDLESRYTYSRRADGAPGWEKDTAWPDPMCVFSGLATVTTNLTFTTGVYVAPVRDLITVAKTVGTAAVLSDDRVRLGVGVGWCKEEFDQTGQDFSTRGRRLDEMIPALRALWAGGWVEFHGTYYDVPPCQMNPSPAAPVPILGGGHSEPALRRAAAPVRRLDRRRRLPGGRGLGPPGRPRSARSSGPGRPASPSTSTSRWPSAPTSTSTGASRRPGSPTWSARRGCSPRSPPDAAPSRPLARPDRRLRVVRRGRSCPSSPEPAAARSRRKEGAMRDA